MAMHAVDFVNGRIAAERPQACLARATTPQQSRRFLGLLAAQKGAHCQAEPL